MYLFIYLFIYVFIYSFIYSFKRIRAFRRAKVDDAMCREMWAEGHRCSVAEGKWLDKSQLTLTGVCVLLVKPWVFQWF